MVKVFGQLSGCYQLMAVGHVMEKLILWNNGVVTILQMAQQVLLILEHVLILNLLIFTRISRHIFPQVHSIENNTLLETVYRSPEIPLHR